MPTFSVTDSPAATASADALLLLSYSTGDGIALAGADRLPKETAAYLTSALSALRARGKADEVVALPSVPGVTAPIVAVSGMGPEGADPTAETLRRASGAAIRTLSGRPSVSLLLPDTQPETAVALAEGAGLAAYAFTAHKGRTAEAAPAKRGRRSKDTETPTGPVERVTLHGLKSSKDLTAQLRRAEVVATANSWARDLVNTHPLDLYPEAFAAAVTQRAPSSVKTTVYDDAQLREMGCGGLIGVGQGSTRGPRLVVLRYAPARAKGHIALVGKGITFDSGGLSLKPANSMGTMKSDMAGAAAVAATLMAVAELRLPVAVTAYCALAENMPSGSSIRPGDVLTQRNGTTVEVLNTDAEGRLVLADAICLAGEDGADVIVDIATLTGAQLVGLGRRTAALCANDDDVQSEVALAASTAGETLWPMPIPEEMKPAIESSVADLKNIGEVGIAGICAAAAFLREFVAEVDGTPIPWAHLDIAGPSFNETGPYGYTPKGATGYGVRTMLAFVEGRAQG